jgi:hypothetical protein
VNQKAIAVWIGDNGKPANRGLRGVYPKGSTVLTKPLDHPAEIVYFQGNTTPVRRWLPPFHTVADAKGSPSDIVLDKSMGLRAKESDWFQTEHTFVKTPSSW